MKKMNKKELRESLLIIFSFISGCLITVLLTSIFQNRTPIIKNNTKIYEKSSLRTSVEKIKGAQVAVETYSGNVFLSTGSGFVYKVDNKKAYILTNEHVIDGNNIKITTADNKTIEGKLLGKDPYIDLAVIEIDKKYIQQVATIGKSDESFVGDVVYTIGAPIGKRYNGSIATGTLSGKDRMVQTTVVDDDDSVWVMKVLQFDAPINPGNSGGPLLNVNGEVIGVCTMKLIKEDIEGMAFAVPIEDALKYVDDLEKGKEIKRPSLGVKSVDIDSDVLEEEKISISEDQEIGTVVIKVLENGNATNILKKGDIIIEMDGMEIKDTSYAKYVLFNHKIGDKIKLKILRNNKEKEVEIKLDK